MSVASTYHRVGERLPELTFGPITRAQLALYAGASGDHNPIHIDTDFAKAAGFPDVFAHGMLSFGVLARAVTRWCGRERLRRMNTRFVALTQVHDIVTCRGEVVEILDVEGERLLRVEISAAAQDGRTTLIGEVHVAY